MFGKNQKPAFRFDQTGSRVLVRDVFSTIQGEGPFTGRPAVFLRLAGCPLHCWFCDTDFDEQYSLWNDVRELAWRCAGLWDNSKWRAAPLVVITGGEPLYQNIGPLIKGLLDAGFADVQIETSGAVKNTPPQLSHRQVTTVVSPKTATVHPRVFQYADAWKYIIGNDTEVSEEGVPVDDTQQTGSARQLAMPLDQSLIYLQPREDYLPCGQRNELANTMNLNRTRDLALQFGYRVSIQTHKILGDA